MSVFSSKQYADLEGTSNFKALRSLCLLCSLFLKSVGLGCSAMDILQTHRLEIVSIAVAVVAIGAGAAYLYMSKKPKGCLDPKNFKDFKLVKLTQLSHNVAKFRFTLPSPTAVLGLPIGQHINCRFKKVNHEVVGATFLVFLHIAVLTFFVFA